MTSVRRTFSTRGGAGIGVAAMAGLLTLLLICLALLPEAGSAASGEPQAKSHGQQHGKKRRGPVRARPSYWGAWIGDQLTGSKPPWDMSAVTRFEQVTGKGLSLLEFAAPFYDCGPSPCEPLNFPTKEMEAIRGYGALPVFSWSSSSIPTPEVPSLPDFQLGDVISGAHDDYIREFAEDARAWGHAFFLRFNWEMNGDWFPWGEGVNGNQPGEYVAAWRHVHDIFTAVGAVNATWVWCPYADPANKFGGLGHFYPGDEYVDWTCMDGYNWASNATNPHPWRSFDTIFKPTYLQIARHVAPKKPVLLAEMASTGSGKAKAAWIRNMFKMLAVKYRRIRGLVWFEQVDRGIDWPLATSTMASQAFAGGLRAGPFRHNRFGEGTTSPIRPPS
jgi:hypothetical protein